MSHFGVTTLAGFGFEDCQPCLAAAGAPLLVSARNAQSGPRTSHAPAAVRRRSLLFLDEVTRRSLELTRTLRNGVRAGSLLAVLDRTTTPMEAPALTGMDRRALADHAAIDIASTPWLN